MISIYITYDNICPEILKHIFQLVNDPAINKTFLIPKVNGEYMGKMSLRYFGPVVWEVMLPQEYKTISDLDTFKEDIKSWIPSNCKCRLCKTYIAGLGFTETS